jgi:CubicO group peptidase (beta-lactamase class C family)
MRAAGVILLLLLGGLAALGTNARASGPLQADGCRTSIAYSTGSAGVSVLVIKDGRVVCEDYANRGSATTAHELWSGTKSFAGVMAAVAAKDGLLTLDERVAETITEWQRDPRKAVVTIRQLLSLTAGQRAMPGGRAPGYAEAIATPLTAAPGTTFQYGPVAFQTFGALIERKLAAKGESADALQFVKTRILGPLGMTAARWRRTPEGDAVLAHGAAFTARDWAKFGEFIRAGGVVRGTSLVHPETFRALFVGTTANPAYGLSWWLPHATTAPDVVTAGVDLGRHAAALPSDMVIAGGAGNQRLYVVPSCGLTVVRQARFNLLTAAFRRRQTASWSDFTFVKPLLDAYCPAPRSGP